MEKSFIGKSVTPDERAKFKTIGGPDGTGHYNGIEKPKFKHPHSGGMYSPDIETDERERIS